MTGDAGSWLPPRICGLRTRKWRHQMEIFSSLLALCARNSPVTGEFPSQSPVTRSFDVFFDLRLIKYFSKQSRGWWFETQLRSLWRHCNDKKKVVSCSSLYLCRWGLGCSLWPSEGCQEEGSTQFVVPDGTLFTERMASCVQMCAAWSAGERPRSCWPYGTACLTYVSGGSVWATCWRIRRRLATCH